MWNNKIDVSEGSVLVNVCRKRVMLVGTEAVPSDF